MRTEAVQESQPRFMYCALLPARPVCVARTPRQYCIACRMADLPLPLGPEMKLTCGVKSTRMLEWHMKLVTCTSLICPAPELRMPILRAARRCGVCTAEHG